MRRLAVGGMAEVYEAEHVRLNARVAIKRLLPGFASRPDITRRLLREARAAATLLHPNIVRVYDIEADDAAPYLVMELIEGPDLRSYLDARAPLSATDACALLTPVFDAIAFAHDRGVVHRDLKPANIIVGTGHDGALRPMVADFGLAHGATYFADSLVTEDQALLGTPAYFAPELCEEGGRPSAATDQYALGVIAYECLTGRRPHEGTNLAMLVRSILDGAVQPPGALRPEVPSDVCAAVMRALSRAPSDRFESVAGFAAAMGMRLSTVRPQASAPFPDAQRDRDASLAPVSVTPQTNARRTPPRVGLSLMLGVMTLLVSTVIWRSLRPSVRRVPAPMSQRAGEVPAAPHAPVPAAVPTRAAATSPQVTARADAGTSRARVLPRRVIARRTAVVPQGDADAGANPRCIGPNGVNLCL